MAAIDDIESCLSQQDWDQAEQLIFRTAMDFIAGQSAPRVDQDRLDAWVEEISTAAPDRAWIAFYQGWVAHSSGQPTLAYMLLQRAARNIEVYQSPEPDELRRYRAVIHAAVAMTALAAGQPADIPAAFHTARQGWLDDDRGHPTIVTAEEAARWTATDPLGLMKFWLEMAAITEALSEFNALAAGLNNLALFALERGEPVAARRLASQSVELRRSHGPRLSYATSLNTLGMAERVVGDLQAAENHLLEARLLGLRHGSAQVAAYALSNYAEVAADRGDPVTAERAFARSSSEKEAMADAFGLAWGWRAWARARRATGDPAGALELATRAFELRQTSFDPNERTLLLTELGACLIANDRGEEGLARLGEAERFVDLFDLKATKAEIAAQRELASNGVPSAPPPPPALRAKLIGEFRLSVGGRELDPAGWKSRRAAEMLRILALHAGRPVHSDRLLDWLWPEEGPAAKPSLNAAVSSIRRELEAHGAERDQLLRDGERYLLTPFVGSDLTDFEALVARARQAETTGAADLAIALLLEALARWQGDDLLPADRYSEWADTEIERATKVARDAREQLASLQLAQGDLDDALLVTVDLVADEPTRETAHRLLIRIHIARSDAAAAQRAYDECVATLARELGVAPAEATRAALRG